MSGHWRFCVAAFLLSAGPSISPAFSNPLTDLFNPAPNEAAAAPAPAPAREACALQPGKPAPGQHWFYRLDGRRKCWYQADEATASAKRHIHHRIDRIAKRRAVAPEENEAELRDKTVLDARAQLLSAASAGAPQPAASGPEVVDTPSVPARETAMPEPAAPIAAQPTIGPLTPDHATPRSVDVETLLAASTLDKDMAASSEPTTTPGAPSAASAGNWELTAARAGTVGTVLITLGLVFLVGSLLASLFFDPETAWIRRT
jgi:hypothetical protein